MTGGTDVALRDQAAAVLRGNDAGGWTKASPLLYPHQWSWDSAFIAIGWAHLDVRRAMTELEHRAAGLRRDSLAQAVLDGRRRAGLGGPAALAQSSMRAPMMTVLSRGSWKYSAASAVSRAVATNKRLRQRLMPGVFPRRISMVDRK